MLQLLYYFCSFGLTAVFSVYTLYRNNNYLGVFIILASTISATLVQVVKKDDNKNEMTSFSKKQLVRDTDFLLSAVVLAFGLFQISTIKVEQLFYPISVLLMYMTMSSTLNENDYYYFHMLCHHLINITLYFNI
jgi:hypothetical protein